MNKTTKDEYLAALEQANQDDEDYQIEDDQSLGELSVAEQSAMRADPPRVRLDGKPVGSEERKRIQPLTVSQVAFAQGIIQGKTYRQALRDLPTTSTPAFDDNMQIVGVNWPVMPT